MQDQEERSRIEADEIRFMEELRRHHEERARHEEENGQLEAIFREEENRILADGLIRLDEALIKGEETHRQFEDFLALEFRYFIFSRGNAFRTHHRTEPLSRIGSVRSCLVGEPNLQTCPNQWILIHTLHFTVFYLRDVPGSKYSTA